MGAKDYSPEEWALVEAQIAKEQAWMHRFDNIEWTVKDHDRYAGLLPMAKSQPTWFLEMLLDSCGNDYVLFKAINEAMNSFRTKELNTLK